MPFCFLLKPKTTFFYIARYHSLYLSLSLVVQLFVTQYITRLSFYKQSRKSYIYQKLLKNTIEFNNNRYIAKLPIKKMNELPPDNHTVARKRLDYLEKQLTKRMVLKKTDEWYIEWQRVATSATTSDNVWQREDLSN